MKRRRSLPLFKSVEPDVYEIDSSSWLKIDTRQDSEEVWALIVAIIEQGRIVACAPGRPVIGVETGAAQVAFPAVAPNEVRPLAKIGDVL